MLRALLELDSFLPHPTPLTTRFEQKKQAQHTTMAGKKGAKNDNKADAKGKADKEPKGKKGGKDEKGSKEEKAAK